MNIGRTAYKNPSICIEDPIFSKQIQLITTTRLALHDLNYQYRELILYHARVDLRGKSLLRLVITANDLLLSTGVESYINIESRDYIEAESGTSYSSKHGDHERRKTIFCNAEELINKLSLNRLILFFLLRALNTFMISALEACTCSNKLVLFFLFCTHLFTYR